MTENETKQVLAQVAALWPNFAITPGITALAWRESFVKNSYPEVRTAVAHLSRTHKSEFPPSVSTIHDTILKLKKAPADLLSSAEAWAEVRSVARLHPERRAGQLSKKSLQALQMVGGWFQFGMTTDNELPFFEKRFREVYDAISESERQTDLGRNEAAALIKSLEAKRLEKGDVQVLKIGELKKENTK